MVPGFDPFDVDEQYVSSMIIEKDYDNYYFPFFQMEVGVPNYLYRAMKKNNFDIKAFVELQHAKFYDIEPSMDASFSTYISSNFYVFLEEMSPEPLETELEKLEKEDGNYNKGYTYGELTVIKLLLYREDYLFNSKKVLNAVLTSPTLPDALTYVLNKAGIGSVMISPPNNYKTYREFIVTPITAMEQIERVCNEYAIHANGTTIFFDFKYLYLLNKLPRSNAYLPQEITVTYLASLMQSGPESVQGKGCYTKSNEYYFANVDPDSISINAESGLNEQTFGNDFMVIDTSTGSVQNINSGATDSKSKPSGATRTLITNRGGASSGSIKQSLLEASKVVTLGFSYIDLDMFAANKEFVLTLEDIKLKKFNGKYRISRMVSVFENEGVYWIPHVTAEFRG